MEDASSEFLIRIIEVCLIRIIKTPVQQYEIYVGQGLYKS